MDTRAGTERGYAWVWLTLPVVIAAGFAAAFAFHHYQDIAASNKRLVEERAATTPADLGDRTVLREVWQKRYSVYKFCQSTVSSVQPSSAQAFEQSFTQSHQHKNEMSYWQSGPTDGHFADCFEAEDWSRLQHLLSSGGAISAPTGGSADYDRMRWVTHFRLFDPEKRVLYQATQTDVLPG